VRERSGNPMIQWHPLFARLLRPVLEDYYDIQTNVPVGDLPRQADIILLRRTSTGRPPFESLWRHLTRWNILEFKGRTESARVADIDLLIEVALGIQRRLQERQAAGKALRGAEVSFWYLANHLGRRFLRDAERLLGGLESVSAGLWRWQTLTRPVWLVSNRDVPVDRESVPVHLVSDEPGTQERAVAQLVASQPDWWTIYSPWLATLHPSLWKEVLTMARRRGAAGGLDFSAVIEEIGIKGLVEQAGVKRVIEELGPGRVIEELGPEQFLARLSPAQREELRRLLQDTKE
jgi:hypothetical protein